MGLGIGVQVGMRVRVGMRMRKGVEMGVSEGKSGGVGWEVEMGVGVRV